jgi:hypothetical protein
MNDLIGDAHMSQGSLTSITFDRFGYPNSALSLNGGFTLVPSGFYFYSTQFSVTIWVYPSNVGSWARIFDFGNPGGVQSTNLKESIQMSFASYVTNNPAFVIYDQITNIIGNAQSHISLEEKKWHFLTATFNGSLLSLYVNGSLTNSSQVGAQIPLVQRTSNLFGKSNYPSDGVSSSYLDDIRFYNISLTHTQINDLMNDVSNKFSACPFISTTTSSSTTTTTNTTSMIVSNSSSTSTTTIHTTYFYNKSLIFSNIYLILNGFV